MGIAKIYNQKQSGISINGIIEDYYAYAGENISAGDFVEFINGIASKKTETSVDTAINNNTSAGQIISAVALDDNSVFIAHSYSSDYYLYGIVCIITGAKISIGIDTVIKPYSNNGKVISTVKINENRVLIAHSDGSQLGAYADICSINGTAITVSGGASIDSGKNSGHKLSAVKIGEDKVFVAHSFNSSYYYLYGTVLTISDTAITTGTITAINTQSSQLAGYEIASVALDDDNVFIAHNYSTNYYLYGVIVTISGTTVTSGTDTALSTTAYAGRVISTALLPTGKIFVAHSTVSNVFYLYGIVCTVSGTSISKGTDTQLSTEQYVGQAISVEALPSGKVVIFHSYGNTENYLYGMVTSISNTTITAKTDTKLNGLEYSGYTISTITLKNGAIFVAHSNSNSYYLNAQIFGVNETTNRPTNNVTITEYETQVRKATTSDIYGVAKTKGVGGDDTGHKDIVSIYTI